jgi:multicomponent Na+:H+ antiporter subunit F
MSVAAATILCAALVSPAAEDGGGVPWLTTVVGIVFGVALAASSWRLIVGPTLPDRVVALDLVGYLVVGLMLVLAIVTGTPALLGVGLVAALILFLATAALAIYLERRGDDAPAEPSPDTGPEASTTHESDAEERR